MKDILVKSMIALLLFVTCLSKSIAQDEGVKWMTFEEALEAQKTEKRKILVDVYTEWCEWCKKMDQSTFKSPFIAKFLNEKFYPVKFDGETERDIEFRGRIYSFVRNGRQGYHELAVELTRARLSYPTIVFLDEDQEVIQALRGFQSSLRFEQIMNYFANDYHKSMPWSKYKENYHTVISRN